MSDVEPMALDAPPSERLTIERVRQLVHHLAETNAPRSVAAQMGELYDVARLMMPGLDWAWLKTVKARLHAAAPAVARQGTGYYQCPTALHGRTINGRKPPKPKQSDQPGRRRALSRRIDDRTAGVCPLRRKNIAAIEFGRHLVQEGDRWFIIIPAGRLRPVSRSSLQFPNSLFRTSQPISVSFVPGYSKDVVQSTLDKPGRRCAFHGAVYPTGLRFARKCFYTAKDT